MTNESNPCTTTIKKKHNFVYVFDKKRQKKIFFMKGGIRLFVEKNK